MYELSTDELLKIDGGTLPNSVSGWMIFAGSVCLCWASPCIGVPALIATVVFG